MTSKIIEYDLKSPNRNYDSVYEVIKSYPVWAHITQSTWFVKTNESCVQIRDKIKKEIDSNDTVFVATLNGEAGWTNAICDSDYLKNNL